MVLTNNDFYIENCACGKTHETSVKKIVIEENYLQNLKQEIVNLGFTGKITAIFDKNTLKATDIPKNDIDYQIVLPFDNLHADEKAFDYVKQNFKQDTQILVAVGAGTIHDITRYFAFENNLPFVACPTAATVDGFVSCVAAITKDGFKQTLPATPPILVVADTSVISKAPLALALAGVGDLLGKAISLADWKIGKILTGEYYCDYISDLTNKAVKAMMKSADKLKDKEISAFEDLTYGLILSGIAIQLTGNSRPASGAEHHISHLLEMNILGECDAMHGEKVGVGTLICAQKYREIAMQKDLFLNAKPYNANDIEFAKIKLGNFAKNIQEENAHDCLQEVTPENISKNYEQLKEVILAIPNYQELKVFLEHLGAKSTIESINAEKILTPEVLYKLTPWVRNRLTFMRLLRML